MALLAGKRCWIVGGTSGLGLSAARRFLDEGAHVVVAGLSSAQNDCAVDALAPRGDFLVQTGDVSQPAMVSHLFATATDFLGGLDVLFHVAGASGRSHGDGALDACSDEGWNWTIAANLTSTFLTNRVAVKYWLAEKQSAAILNMASVLAIAPSPHYFDTCAYAAAKGGVIALSRQLAARYAPDGIRVNVLAPGLMDTPMAARACQDPAIREFLKVKQPLAGGPGSAEDCAAAAVFLCSDAARLITGVVLPVDGGWCVSEGQYGNTV